MVWKKIFVNYMFDKEVLYFECVFYLNLYVGILIFKVMVLGYGVFGKWLGYEGRFFMNEINVFVKDFREIFIFYLKNFCFIVKESWSVIWGYVYKEDDFNMFLF